LPTGASGTIPARMDKAHRAELLRQRFKPSDGMPYIVTARKPKPIPHEPKPWRNMAWPEIIPDTKRAPGWMREADVKPKAVSRPKRNACVTALTRIAQKAPRTLVRSYRSAEQLFASRARR
jgi:hypothetical protein